MILPTYMDKKAQNALDESKKTKQELNDVNLKLETPVIKNKVPVNPNDGSDQTLFKL